MQICLAQVDAVQRCVIEVNSRGGYFVQGREIKPRSEEVDAIEFSVGEIGTTKVLVSKVSARRQV